MKRLILILVFILMGCVAPVEPPPIEEPEPTPDPFLTRRVHVDGTWYELPLKFKELVDAGWFPDVITSVEEELAKTIEPRTYVQKYYIRNERYMMAVTLFNPSDAVITIADAWVGEVEAENRKWLKDDILDFKFDDSFSFTTTKDELRELWGEPTEANVEGLYEVWTFQHNNISFTRIHWDVKTDVIFRVLVSNMK